MLLREVYNVQLCCTQQQAECVVSHLAKELDTRLEDYTSRLQQLLNHHYQGIIEGQMEIFRVELLAEYEQDQKISAQETIMILTYETVIYKHKDILPEHSATREELTSIFQEAFCTTFNLETRVTPGQLMVKRALPIFCAANRREQPSTTASIHTQKPVPRMNKP